MNTEKIETCRCPHHLIIPTLIALIGIVLLLGRFELLSEYVVGILWPSFLALIGLQRLFSHRCKCCTDHHHCHHMESAQQ